MIASVIIPVYNHVKYITSAIRSVLPQLLNRPYEIIVINDGSTDGSGQLAKEYMRGMVNTTYMELDKNSGISAAKNAGISIAQGEYIICLDSDNMFYTTLLDKFVRKMDEGSDIVFSNYRKFGAENVDIIMSGDYNYIYNNIKHYATIPCFGMFRKSMWEELDGFNETLIVGEDWEFFARLLFNYAAPFHINEVLYKYRTYEGEDQVNSISYREGDKFERARSLIREMFGEA
jgi:glycosyltransferase involved in cell wall biosynthesis